MIESVEERIVPQRWKIWTIEKSQGFLRNKHVNLGCASLNNKGIASVEKNK